MLDDLDDIHPLFHGAPSTTEFKKLRKRIVRYTREAIEQYGMIERDARWLVCLSGGKDSYTLLAVLYELKWRGLLPVDILACNLDQGQPNFPATVLPAFLEKMGVPHRIEYQDSDLCGSQDGLQRQQVKQILDGWEANSPGRRQVMFRSLMNARPSHLLDPNLFDFAGLARDTGGETTS